MRNDVEDENDDELFETVTAHDGKRVRILRDGAHVRTSMMLRDAMPNPMLTDLQKSVAENAARRPHRQNAADKYFERPVRVTDGEGDTIGLHWPGFRLTHDSDAASARQLAYDEYDAALARSWKTGGGQRDAEAYTESAIGTVCTVRNAQFPRHFGEPGHVRQYKGEIICVPDSVGRRQDAMTMDQIYAEYDRELENAWRPRR